MGHGQKGPAQRIKIGRGWGPGVGFSDEGGSLRQGGMGRFVFTVWDPFVIPALEWPAIEGMLIGLYKLCNISFDLIIFVRA